MNDRPHVPDPEELRQARLTAYALDQLGPQERAEVEEEVLVSARDLREVQEIRAVAEHLRRSAGTAEPPAPLGSAVLRAAVESRLAEVEEKTMESTNDSQSVRKWSGAREGEILDMTRDSERLGLSSGVKMLLGLGATAGCLLLAASLILPAFSRAREGSSSALQLRSDSIALAPQKASAERAAAHPPAADEGSPPAGARLAAAETQCPVVSTGAPEVPAQDRPAAAPAAMLPAESSESETTQRGYEFKGASKKEKPADASTFSMLKPSPSAESGPADALSVGGKPAPGAAPVVLDPQVDARRANVPAKQPTPALAEYGAKLQTGLSAPGTFSADLDIPFRPARGTEQYELPPENPFLAVSREPKSTFSIDVDTASYANVRRFLTQGQLPPGEAVRIEEMVNYFRYDYPPPKEGEPFSASMEAAECPWNGEHRLVRIGLKGRDVPRQERGPCNLVFLLDVSGSMDEPDKLPLVKEAMKMLAGELGEDDRVAVVTYASGVNRALESTNGSRKDVIRQAIDRLSPGGSTNGSGGIQLAYDEARKNFRPGGVNRVILATDGDFNVGISDDDELVRFIQEQAQSGVFLTVLGVGTGNLKDARMEKLADKGNGAYAYLDSLREARRVLVEQMSGSLVTIAKDVKIQVEFNPAQVAAYRLVGYENRVMAAEDFRNDRKDAGEIGAGHTVTALYEVIPAGQAAQGPDGEPLKYQQAPARPLTEAGRSGEMLTLYLRYKQPDGERAREISFPLTDAGRRFGQASPDFRFAASVAMFGMLLRGSEHAGSTTLAAVEEIATSCLSAPPPEDRLELVDLIRRARQLTNR